MNDEEQSVKVEEVEEVNLETIKRHLDNGESVFITPKCLEQDERATKWDETRTCVLDSHLTTVQQARK